MQLKAMIKNMTIRTGIKANALLQRISLEAIFDKIVVPIKVDLSTGDVITPKEIDFNFNLMFEDRKIDIPAYNLETILAEKYETIISRGILNTRARDFYDVYILTNLYWEDFSNGGFKRALNSTASKRGTAEKMRKSISVIEELRLDNNIKKIWDVYSNKFNYANGIIFEDTLDSMDKLSELI